MAWGDVRVPVALLTSGRPGAIVTVRGDQGKEFRGRVVSVEGDNAVVKPFEELKFSTESLLEITLIQALPKKEKMELVIQKATELGVTRIVPCTSSRSISVEEREKNQPKTHRWPSIALKATEQCRRRATPEILPCADFHAAIGMQDNGPALRLILYEREEEHFLEDITENCPHRVTVACGPEGGFTQGEVSFARSRGFVPVRLGGRVMRCETATIAALSIIQFIWGDLGRPRAGGPGTVPGARRLSLGGTSDLEHPTTH